MRITQIRSPKDAAWFVVDQLAHGLIGWVPVAAFARRWQDVAIAAVIILTVREVEQGRRTVKEWLKVRRAFDEGDLETLDALLGDGAKVVIRPGWLDLVRDLHLPDRVADVCLGANAAISWSWLWSWIF